MTICVNCKSENVIRDKPKSNDEWVGILRYVCNDCGYLMAFKVNK